MRTPLTAAVFVFLGLIHPIASTISALPEDTEGSGYDLGTSDDGSGDWPEQDEVTNIMDHPNSKERTFDGTVWPAGEFGSGYVILSNSKSFLENKQIVSAIIAGGVTGIILGAIIVAIIIFKWRNKVDGGYIQAQQTRMEEDV
ncbi:hypothetical protein F2P81_024281 [Scophthalmus maximus]|uniref:Syndecan/Neurexin domain-containing protein n=1 Tax=Scophthalmus maximus TaxID=52904 RepID=A0A6A4RX50_SCOMX|nr:hypothetical protein F2P81_024281 [Scophthalmus maximus]